jgi:hypothetical protein
VLSTKKDGKSSAKVAVTRALLATSATPLAGKTRREPIGVYDSSAPPRKLQPTPRGHGIAVALEKCTGEWARMAGALPGKRGVS